LSIAILGTEAIVTWPSSALGFTLEQTSDTSSQQWLPVDSVVTSNSQDSTVTVSIGQATAFYRLKHP
jgi:hypothetical protein